MIKRRNASTRGETWPLKSKNRVWSVRTLGDKARGSKIMLKKTLRSHLLNCPGFSSVMGLLIEREREADRDGTHPLQSFHLTQCAPLSQGFPSERQGAQGKEDRESGSVWTQRRNCGWRLGHCLQGRTGWRRCCRHLSEQQTAFFRVGELFPVSSIFLG